MAKKKANGNIPPGIMKAVEVERIRAEADIQARVEMNFATITTYFERMMEGDKFPPVIVFDDGRELWLADGFHRLAAAKRACRKKIDARVVKGSREDAAWFALGANRTNGLPMSTADKMRAIKQALLLRPQESNRLIARHIGVSHNTVEKYRRQLESTGQIDQLDRTVGADGRERPSRRPTDNDPPPPPPSTTIKTDDQPPVVPDEPPTVVKADPPPGVTDQSPKVDDQLPSGPDLPKDRVGNLITDPTIAAIFKRDRELVELCTAVSKVKTTVLKAIDANDPLYVGHLVRGQFQTDAENLRRQIDHIRPYAICPYCEATQPKRQACNACHGHGWVNQSVYVHAPKEKK